MCVHYPFGTVLALLPAAVTALRPTVGGGGGYIFADNATFDPPSLEYGNIIMYGILLFGTIIQFGFSARALCRTSGPRLPAAGVAIALIVLFITYALGIALVATTYIIPDPRSPKVDALRLQAVSLAFFYLKDPAMFAAIALVIRNRHCSVRPASPATVRCTCAAGVLFMVMIALIGADVGDFESTIRSMQSVDVSFDEAVSRWNKSDKFSYAFVAFHILGTVFLSVIAFFVKARTKSDRVMTLTLFVIIPLLALHAVARLIFAIISARAPLFYSYTPHEMEYALDVSTSTVYGALYVGIMTVLAYLLSYPSLWSVQSLSEEDASAEKRVPLAELSPQDPSL